VKGDCGNDHDGCIEEIEYQAGESCGQTLHPANLVDDGARSV
jgi:hypothetical protein